MLYYYILFLRKSLGFFFLRFLNPLVNLYMSYKIIVIVSGGRGASIRFIATQGVTYTRETINSSVRLTISVPNTYDGRTNPSYFTITTTSGLQYQESLWTKRNIPINPVFDLTARVIDGILTASGSLDVTFTNNNKPIETFVDIPGHLDTIKLNNGGYADAGVEGIFIQLKKYLYPESIFNDILNKLSEFFTSEGFKQGVTESIILLNKEFVAGKITIDQFNELVTKSVEELAGQYGENYMKNYNAVKAAIDKYKYLLIN